MQQGKKSNVQQQAHRRANVLQTVKNPFDYHKNYLKKAEIQDRYATDWKSIPSLTTDLMCDLGQISYCVFFGLHAAKNTFFILLHKSLVVISYYFIERLTRNGISF